MVTPLSNAQELMNTVLKATANGKNVPSEFAVEMAKAYAAIAQAEQLKRIADALHHSLDNGEEWNIAKIIGFER